MFTNVHSIRFDTTERLLFGGSKWKHEKILIGIETKGFCFDLGRGRIIMKKALKGNSAGIFL